jgi:hypothetical protein
MTLEYEESEDGEPSSTAELLSEMTGRPKEDFEADGYEHPSLDDLELVSNGEVEG